MSNILQWGRKQLFGRLRAEFMYTVEVVSTVISRDTAQLVAEYACYNPHIAHLLHPHQCMEVSHSDACDKMYSMQMPDPRFSNDNCGDFIHIVFTLDFCESDMINDCMCYWLELDDIWVKLVELEEEAVRSWMRAIRREIQSNVIKSVSSTPRGYVDRMCGHVLRLIYQFHAKLMAEAREGAKGCAICCGKDG